MLGWDLYSKLREQFQTLCDAYALPVTLAKNLFVLPAHPGFLTGSTHREWYHKSLDRFEAPSRIDMLRSTFSFCQITPL